MYHRVSWGDKGDTQMLATVGDRVHAATGGWWFDHASGYWRDESAIDAIVESAGQVVSLRLDDGGVFQCDALSSAIECVYH